MSRRKPRILLTLAAGFGIWAAGFAAIYAWQAIGCAFGLDRIQLGPASLHRILLIGLALAVVAAGTGLAGHLWRQRVKGRNGGPRSFLSCLAGGTALAAVAASLVTFSPVAWLTVCS